MTDVTQTTKADSHVYTARVARVIQGENPYGVAYSEAVSGPITFSLNPAHDVWCEETYPDRGTKIILTRLRKKDKGWRAYQARYLRPEDKKHQQ